MNGKSVYACRYDMGRQLAHEEPVEADLVIGVPDCGLPPAEGYSHESGIPFGRASSRTVTWAARLSSPRRSCAPWACA